MEDVIARALICKQCLSPTMCTLGEVFYCMHHKCYLDKEYVNKIRQIMIKPFKDCNYCCEPKECAIKGCYNLVMNISGKEMCYNNDIIIPVKTKKSIEDIKGIPKPTIISTPYGSSNWLYDYYFKNKRFSFDIETDRIAYQEALKLRPELIKQLREGKWTEDYMNIYSFPLTRCSKTIWSDRNGKSIRIKDMPIPYLRNVYLKLLNSALAHTVSQYTISAITDKDYPGRYELDRIKRAHSFLYEMCPTWNEIVEVGANKGICNIYAYPKDWRIEYSDRDNRYSYNNSGLGKSEPIAASCAEETAYIRRNRKMEAVMNDKVKLTNGKVMTDANGNQYLLFPIE